MKILKESKYSLLSKISKYSFIFVLAFTLLSPIVFADGERCTGVDRSGTPTPYGCDPAAFDNTGGDPAAFDNTKPNTSTNTVNITSGIENPLGDGIDDIPKLIAKIIEFVLLIGVPIVALAIIYCGFLFVTAQGNSEKLKKAKQALLYTLIGAALLLGAFVVAEAIKGTVDDITSTT